MTGNRDEFVFGVKPTAEKERKYFRIEDLDRFDEILREDNRLMWERIRKHHQKEVVEIFTPVQKKYESEPEMVKVATLPVEDARRKFG